MKPKFSSMFNATTWLKLRRTVLSRHDFPLLAGQVWNAQV